MIDVPQVPPGSLHFTCRIVVLEAVLGNYAPEGVEKSIASQAYFAVVKIIDFSTQDQIVFAEWATPHEHGPDSDGQDEAEGWPAGSD